MGLVVVAKEGGGGEMRKRIYVAGAINADNCDDVFDNLRRGMTFSLHVLLNPRMSPFNPFHGFLYRLVANADQAEGLRKKGVFYDADLAWLRVADAVYVVPRSEDSVGVKQEIEYAEKWGIPVFYSYGDLEIWLNEQPDTSDNNDR